MSDYEFPDTPEIEDAYRAAQTALLGIIPAQYTLGRAEEELHLTELISHLRTLHDEAEMAVAHRLGPIINWRADRRDGDWEPVVCGVDLTGEGRDFGAATPTGSAFEGPGGRWSGSPLDTAARAYRREARWDFSPDESGLWILMLAPVSGFGGSDERDWHYSGHLTGFLILHDRDDGDYESVAHIWTAAAWRRRGIARRLMDEARDRFPLAGVEGPYTEDGSAFLRAVGEP